MKLKRIATILVSIALLVSALGMTSMATTASAAALPTSAADFTDASSIKNTQAVDLLVSLGIINGSTDGNGYAYHPANLITRAEMAKIIAVALAGDQVLTGTAKFADTAGHWAEPYIAYCVQVKAINGIGDGTFQPDSNVTGVQVAKMLLGTMGVTGLTGASWAENTMTAANEKSLFTGVSSDPSAAINRDDAALLIYNALQSVGGKLTAPQATTTTTTPATGGVKDEDSYKAYLIAYITAIPDAAEHLDEFIACIQAGTYDEFPAKMMFEGFFGDAPMTLDEWLNS
jgi:hypothetical protein